jgi:hypothetical protein
MSIIHVNQIKSHIERLFSSLIDLADVEKADPHTKEAFLLTRSLAAYAIHHLSGATLEVAAAAVTDGGDDNGIDAIYHDESNKRLYFVQSKWIRNGSGEPDNGDVKKFLAGVRDLFNLEFDRFNSKVRSKQTSILAALNDPATRYEVVLVYTGHNGPAPHSKRDLSDLATEMNDTSEVLFITVLNQSDLHNSLVAGVSGEPINLEIGIKSWGRKEAPYNAYYGQLSGAVVASWWRTYRTRLFARNLRSMLGETEVNAEMRQTLEQRPDDFWYFNNGITIVARRAQRAMAGGGSHDFAIFHCDDISVVNGAQTVGAIGKLAEGNNQSLDNVFVPVRIIIRGEDQNFGDEVTRANNRQNRIENRDFAVLDPEQNRIRRELAVDSIEYQLARSENVSRSDTAFDLVEATAALACASAKPRLAVQAKREIGKFWEDITKAPYKELFGPAVSGPQVWHAVQIVRRIEKALHSRDQRPGSHQKHCVIAIHGNRLIAALVFAFLPAPAVAAASTNLDAGGSEQTIIILVDQILDALISLIGQHFGNPIIPTLFKNLTKCELLFSEVKSVIKASRSQPS